MKGKRTMALIAACCLLGACTPVPAQQVRQYKIGVAQYRQDDTFIGLISEHLAAIAKQREQEDGVKITVNFADGRGNQGIQNDQVDKFVSQGYDAICVNEVDRTAASYIIDKAKAAGIPLVFFNREPVEEDLMRWDKVYYVGSDAGEIGDLQGQIIADAFTRNPEADRNGDGILQYVMLEGEPGHQDAVIRTEYSIRRLRLRGLDMEKLANDTANWQRAQGMAKMRQWLTAYGSQIEAVISNNDDMALGALDAYRAAQINELPLVVGADATPAAVEAVDQGRMTGTVVNDAEDQARAIFEIAYALCRGADPAKQLPELQGRYVFRPPARYDHLSDNGEPALTGLPAAATDMLQETFGLTVTSVSGPTVETDFSGRTIYRFTVNDTARVAVDVRGRITEFDAYGGAPQTTAAKGEAFAEEFIAHISAQLPKDYRLVQNRRSADNDFRELIWQRELPCGIANEYQAVQALVDLRSATVFTYTTFELAPQAEAPVLSKEAAQARAEAFLTSSNIENAGPVQSVTLQVCRENGFWSDNEPETNEVRLAYVADTGAYLVYVDAVTGEIFGVDMWK